MVGWKAGWQTCGAGVVAKRWKQGKIGLTKTTCWQKGRAGWLPGTPSWCRGGEAAADEGGVRGGSSFRACGQRVCLCGPGQLLPAHDRGKVLCLASFVFVSCACGYFSCLFLSLIFSQKTMKYNGRSHAPRAVNLQPYLSTLHTEPYLFVLPPCSDLVQTTPRSSCWHCMRSSRLSGRRPRRRLRRLPRLPKKPRTITSIPWTRRRQRQRRVAACSPALCPETASKTSLHIWWCSMPCSTRLW